MAGSITVLAVNGAGAFVVSDVVSDARFTARRLLPVQKQTRFYVDSPIEADSGERIGVLCVFNPKPRRAGEVDNVLLRELALLIQSEFRHKPG